MKELLKKLLRSELGGHSPADVLTVDEIKSLQNPTVLQSLYKLSAAHDLQHIVGAGLYKIGVNDDKFKQAQIFAACRYEKSAYTQRELSTFFGELSVCYIPLKGAYISRFYPASEMRTSCDIDILVHRDEIYKISQALTERLSYRKIKDSGHDVQFVSPLGVHLELHFTLSEGNDKAGEILSHVWDKAVPTDNPYELQLPLDFNYLYYLSHMVKHFRYGGCGIRSIIDMWIFNHRCPDFDTEAAEKIAAQGKLERFENIMHQLSELWFSDIEPFAKDSDIIAQVEEFILNGGVYGNTENRVKITRAEKKNNLGYLKGRLFLPYDHIKYEYPILQRYRILLPFCQIHRWFRLFSKDTAKRIAHELKVNRGITTEIQNDMREMLRNLGIT